MLYFFQPGLHLIGQLRQIGSQIVQISRLAQPRDFRSSFGGQGGRQRRELFRKAQQVAGVSAQTAQIALYVTERRIHFVRNTRREIAKRGGTLALQGLLTGRCQFALQVNLRFLTGDNLTQILNQSDKNLAFRGHGTAHAQLHREDFTVLAHALKSAALAHDLRFARAQKTLQVAVVPGTVRRRHQHADILAEHLIELVAKNLARRVVERKNRAFGIDQHDAVGRIGEHPGQCFLHPGDALHGTHARAQHVEIKWLGKVLIGAGFQPPNDIGIAVERGHDDQRHPETGANRLDLARGPDPADALHDQIHQHHVGR